MKTWTVSSNATSTNAIMANPVEKDNEKANTKQQANSTTHRMPTMENFDLRIQLAKMANHEHASIVVQTHTSRKTAEHHQNKQEKETGMAMYNH